MKRFKIGLVFLFCILQQTVLAAPTTDTAMYRIYRLPTDTQKVMALIKAGWAKSSNEPKKSIRYAAYAFQLSRKKHWIKGEIEAHLLKAKCFDYLGEYKKALPINFKALYLSESIKDEVLMARALRQIGGMYQALGNYSKAIIYHEKSLRISERINYLKGIGSSLSDLGLVYRLMSENSIALQYFFKSIAIKLKIGDTRNIATTYTHISYIYAELGDFEKAINYGFLSLKICQKINYQWGIANNLSIIGIQYLMMKDYTKALEYLKKSIQINEEIGNRDSYSSDYLNIGSIYQETTNFKNALYYFEKALSINIETGNIRSQAGTYRVIGNLYFSLQKYDSAIINYQRTFNIDKSLQNSSYLIEDYLSIANAYFKKEDYKKSKNYLDHAIELIKFHPSLINEVQIKEIESLLLEKSKKHKESLQAYKQYIFLRDSLHAQNNIKGVAFKEAKFEFDKKTLADSLKNIEIQKGKDLQINLQKSELQTQKIKQNAMLGGILLLFVFAWLLFSRYKAVSQQRKTEQQLVFLEKEQALIEERTRIADEMHDDVGADLSNLLLKIRINEKSQTAAKSIDFKGLKSSTNSIIHKIDEIIWSLNAQRDTLNELLIFMGKYHRTLIEENQLAGDADIPNEISLIPISAKLRRNIFLTVKEILNNSLKHAKATKIDLLVSLNNNTLDIHIIDDGKGFDAEKSYPGNGINNMQKRLENANGKMQIKSCEKSGTKVSLCIAFT